MATAVIETNRLLPRPPGHSHAGSHGALPIGPRAGHLGTKPPSWGARGRAPLDESARRHTARDPTRRADDTPDATPVRRHAAPVFGEGERATYGLTSARG